MKKYKYSYKKPSDNKKKIKWIILIAAAVLVVALALTAVLLMIKDGKQIANVVLSKAPNRTEYRVGDEPSYDGIILQVILKNGKTYEVTDPAVMAFTGFNSTKSVEEQQIFVSYEGYTVSYTVTINKVYTGLPVLERIEMEENDALAALQEKVHRIGGSVDITDLKIRCYYQNAASNVVDLQYWMITDPERFEEDEPDIYRVYIYYMDERGIPADPIYFTVKMIDPNVESETE